MKIQKSSFKPMGKAPMPAEAVTAAPEGEIEPQRLTMKPGSKLSFSMGEDGSAVFEVEEGHPDGMPADGPIEGGMPDEEQAV